MNSLLGLKYYSSLSVKVICYLIVLFFVATTFLIFPSYASFSIDSTYGNNGEVITSFGNNAALNDTAFQTDGKAVAVGFNSNGGHHNWAITKYNIDGSLDTSFGTTGKVTQVFGYDQFAHAVGIQINGKIVVAGTDESTNGPILWTIGRYNIDGTLDSTFGNTGISTISINNIPAKLLSLKIQPDDKIVTAGYTGDCSINCKLAVIVRQNSNGSLDQTFGSNGIVTANIGGASFVRVRSVALQPDGKILIFGELTYGGDSSVYVARLNSDGSLDTSFGTNGSTIDHFGTSDSAERVVLQTDGKIVAAGYYNNGGGNMMFLIRYNADGSHDISFGSSGLVLNPFSATDYVSSLLFQSDGKIITGGSAVVGGNTDFALSKFNTDGTIDTTFGSNGRLITPVGSGGYGYIQSMAFQADTKIVAMGVADNGSYLDWALARYSDNSTNSGLTVPALKQTSDPWGSQIYDGANNWSTGGTTISNWGCALTSDTMILQYNGINKLPDGTPLDPGALNTWLKNNNGYDDGINNGFIIPSAISLLSKQAKSINNITNFDALETNISFGSDTNLLTSDLNNGQPDMIGVSGNTHYVVAKGINAATFNINDPFFNRTTLADGYGNTFASLTRYIPSFTDLSYIFVSATPNVQLTLKDSGGNSVGQQYIQQPLVGDVTGISSGLSSKILFYKKPVSGDYQLLISGSENQNYKLNIYLYDKDGNVKKISLQGTAGIAADLIAINFNNQSINNADANRFITLQSIIDDLNENFSLQAINNGSYNALLNQIQNAQKDINKGKIQVNQKLNIFINLLNDFRGKGISESSYQILFYDVQYLKSHL